MFLLFGVFYLRFDLFDFYVQVGYLFSQLFLLLDAVDLELFDLVGVVVDVFQVLPGLRLKGRVQLSDGKLDK